MTDSIKSFVSNPLYRASTWLIGFLLVGNLFFLGRLVIILDRTQEKVWQLAQQIAVMEATVGNLPKKAGK